MADERFYESGAGLRRSAPAALRNREAIAEVLSEWLPERGLVLEVASGTGEHALHFARRFPGVEWQPSDMHPAAIASIRAWSAEEALANLCDPVLLDASSSDWPIGHADAIVAINMVHISPWRAALGLIEGAARLLPAGGPLILYGPWLAEDVETAASNIAFDADLRSRNPEWGLRRVESFAAEAARRGLNLVERRPMPANNFMLLLRRNDAPH